MDVICLGILVADIFASPLDSLPVAGQLGLTDRFLLGAGGCASNTAACLSRLGRTVRVFGKVGDDLFGNFVLADLERLGVDTSSVSRSHSQPTSGTVIINVHGEDRRYIHCIGANADFSFSDVDCALARRKNEMIQVGAYSVNSIDGSGAGDAFAAGFISGLLEGWSLESTLRFASAVGASCTRALGCINGVFRFDEAQAFVSENTLKLERIRS